MTYDFCLGCGVLLSPYVYECPICGFDNSFSEYEDEDVLIDDAFINDSSGDFNPDENAW